MAQYSVGRGLHFGANNKDIHEVVMLADKNGNILNTYGAAANIPISAGLVDGYSFVEKFGSNLSVGANTETIWSYGGLYTYLDVASTLFVDTVPGDDGEDNATGTGARTVIIEGLDASYSFVSEEVTVAGAASSTEFLRVNRAYVQTTGTVLTNTKPLLVSTGANGTGTVLADIATHGTGSNEEGFGQTMLGLYTVPAGKTGYLMQWTLGSSGTSSVQAFLRYRPFANGKVYRTLDNIYYVNGYYVKDYVVPIQIPEKTDIEVQTYNTATGVAVSTSFNIILIDNPA